MKSIHVTFSPTVNLRDKTTEKSATFYRGGNRSLMKLCNVPKITQLERGQNQAYLPFSTTPTVSSVLLNTSNRKYKHISLLVACTQ